MARQTSPESQQAHQKEPTRPPCEVISIVSGKGGTGKTFIAACLAYALQQANHRVCLIDADLGTQGLSLFILGPSARIGTTRGVAEEHSLYHMVHRWEADSNHLPVPREADREEDHGLVYHLLVSNKQFYDRRLSLGVESEATAARELLNESMGEVSDRFRENYRQVIPSLFNQLRDGGAYDYIIVDTRGGFSELTLVPVVFSDSFVVVTEPDFTSFHQLAKLLTNIDLMSLQEKRTPYIRGILVNKAVDNGEEKFRSLLGAQFGVEFGQSWALPLDIEAVKVYKEQLVPYKTAPDLPFCTATLKAFTDFFDLVTIEWSREEKQRWRSLVKTVEEARGTKEAAARRAQSESQQREQEAERRIKEALTDAEKARTRAQALESELGEAKSQIGHWEKQATQSLEQTHAIEIKALKKTAGYRTWLLVLLGLLVLATSFYVLSYRSLESRYKQWETQQGQLSDKYQQLESQYGDLSNKYRQMQAEYGQYAELAAKYKQLEEKYNRLIQAPAPRSKK